MCPFLEEALGHLFLPTSLAPAAGALWVPGRGLLLLLGVVHCPASVVPIVPVVLVAMVCSVLLVLTVASPWATETNFLAPTWALLLPGLGMVVWEAGPRLVTAPSVPMSLSWPDLVCFCLLG